MKKYIKYLPAVLAAAASIASFIICSNPVALAMGALVVFMSFVNVDDQLSTVAKFLYVAGAGAFAAIAIKGIFLGMLAGTVLAALWCAFCTSVLYFRMKV